MIDTKDIMQLIPSKTFINIDMYNNKNIYVNTYVGLQKDTPIKYLLDTELVKLNKEKVKNLTIYCLVVKSKGIII